MFSKFTTNLMFDHKSVVKILKYSTCDTIPPFKHKMEQRTKEKMKSRDNSEGTYIDTVPKDIFPEEDRCREHGTKTISIDEPPILDGLQDIPKHTLKYRVARIFKVMLLYRHSLLLFSLQ